MATYVPKLKKKYRPQVTIADDENVAFGRGVTGRVYKKFLQDSVDVVMISNHTWDNKDVFEFIDGAGEMVRPVNFPKDVPGQGMASVRANQLELVMVNLQTRTFMVPLEGPFEKTAELVAIARRRTPLASVDFHGGTTSEKQAMNWFLNGQVSVVVGTHTHVQAGDTRVLPKGTAFLSDVGMTSPHDRILKMKREPVTGKFMTALPKRFEVVETGRIILSVCTLEIDNQTDQTKMIKPI